MAANLTGHAVTGAAALLGLAATLFGEAVQLDATTTIGGLGTGILGSLAWQLWRLVGSTLKTHEAKLAALKDEARHRDDERQHWLASLRALRYIRAELTSQRHTPVEGIPLGTPARVDAELDELDDGPPAPGLYHQARTPPPPRRR